MAILSVIIAGVLCSIALIHLAWATGSRFPAGNERELVGMAVGFRGHTRMPGAIPCIVVAAALLMVAAALFLSTGPARILLLGGAASVFVARGLAAYAPAWRRLTPQKPFADLDRRVYGPLSLLLGIGLFLLL